MTEETKSERVTVAERLKDVAGVEQALTRAEKQAVAEHARAGHKIPIWRDNKVVWETPEVPQTAATTTDT
jgi:hypothetical protein